MNGLYIHSFRARYRPRDERLAPVLLRARLDRVVKDALKRQIAESLDASVGDQRVYVIDRLRIRSRLPAAGRASDDEVARLWARAIAAGLDRALRRGGAEGVVIFASRAAQVAACAVDLLAGRTPDRARYAGLARHFEGRSPREALPGLLTAEPEHLLEILHLLARGRALESVLQALGPSDNRKLLDALRTVAAEAARGHADQLRILFHIALTLRGTNLGPDESERLLQSYAAGVADVPSWSHPKDLSDAVLGALDWLGARRVGSAPDPPLPELPTGLGWLDRAHLLSGLAARHRAVPTGAAPAARESCATDQFATPPAATLHKRLAHLLAELPARGSPAALTLKAIALLGGEESEVRRSLAMDLTNAAIRLHLALGDPRRLNAGWRHALESGTLPDALSPDQVRVLRPARPTIREHGAWLASLLTQVASIATGLSRAPDEDARFEAGQGRAPAAGDAAPAAVRSFPTITRADPIPDRAPGSARRVFAAARDSTTSTAAVTSSRSPFAGLAVALRVLTDIRFMTVLGAAAAGRASRRPNAQAWIGAFLARWAGCDAWGDDGRLDAGLTLMAGMARPPTRAELAQGVGPPDPPSLAALDAALVAALCQQQGGVPPPEPASADLAAVAAGGLGPAELDAWLGRAACLLLAHWARWLRGFQRSSAGFLLHRFLRRPGGLVRRADSIEILLPAHGLDVVLRLAGYLEPVPAVPWLDGLRLEFRIEHAR